MVLKVVNFLFGWLGNCGNRLSKKLIQQVKKTLFSILLQDLFTFTPKFKTFTGKYFTLIANCSLQMFRAVKDQFIMKKKT